LQAVHEVGQFDISESVLTVGAKIRDIPPKVFLTVIQKDGSFKAVDRLRRRDGAGTRRVRLLGLVE
jgi:branched-chain amino acid transport system substrate-binding protein